MKSTILKIFVITTLMIFLGAGASLAHGWKNKCYPGGPAHGYYKHRVYHYYHCAPPRPIYVEHYYRPVVVKRHYYPAPVYYAPPAPSGFFFGMSVADGGSAFSFGVSGR
jgi:hypothetical protein